MGSDFRLTFADIERASSRQDPELGELLIQFMEQGDPPPGQPEEIAAEAEPPALAPDAWTLARLRQAVAPFSLERKTATERKVARREAWEAILAAPNPPPRLKLGGLLIELYQSGAEPARAALMKFFGEGKLAWGAWQAFKRIYKLSEERCDAAMFGVLAGRIDRMQQTEIDHQEIGAGTLIYLRRRAWRYLRLLGQAVPEAFPPLAVQVLRSYPAGYQFSRSWVANQIWGHKDLVGAATTRISGPPAKLDRRAFDDAWKLSSAPLLRLLEDAPNDVVCGFAIRALRQDFPDVLRNVAPAWLARLGSKPLASVHDFIVQLLSSSPEYHQSKLRGLGLHDMVLALLTSESRAARTYAVEYARVHAPDMAVADLLGLLSEEHDAPEVRSFAASRLMQKSPAELGLDVLARMVGIEETRDWATAQIRQSHKPSDITPELFVFLMVEGNQEQRQLVKTLFESSSAAIPTSYLTRLLDTPDVDWQSCRFAYGLLAQRPGREVGAEWLKKALVSAAPNTSSQVASWLRAGMLSGDDLDVDWVKELVARPRFRDLGLELLGNPSIVAPGRVGLDWLLKTVARTDEVLHQFAERYLLAHFGPEDFGAGAGAQIGKEKLWSLAAGPDSPEPVRTFAALYLKVNHPDLASQHAETAALGLTPRFTHADYPIEWGRRCLFDTRADVRRLGAAIARQELVRWGDRKLLYAMADSSLREPRAMAAELLLGRDPAAPTDAEKGVPADWLVPDLVFALAESAYKATREVALTVIRRHYERLAEPATETGVPAIHRLAWLMESPDRDVQLQAVRLLWDRHRPRPQPATWKPKKHPRHEVPLAATPFDSTEALRHFLRTVLLGLPPGRMERREEGSEAADRPWPASVAKQRLVAAVEAMALEDAEFAQVILPVIEEMAGSESKGEWQSCVAALAAIRKAHPGLPVALPPIVGPHEPARSAKP